MRVIVIAALLASFSCALHLAPKHFDAYSGHILVRNDQHNATARDFIELWGWSSPNRNTPCGHAARTQLHQLIHSGRLYLEEVDDVPQHPSFGGKYMRAFDDEGQPLFNRMLRDGLAFPQDDESDGLVLHLHAQARQNLRGCHRSVDDHKPWETTSDNDEASSQKVHLDTAQRQLGAQGPTHEMRRWPTGFTSEIFLRDLVRPVDFLFLPDGTMLIGINDGVVYTVDGRRVRSTPFIDLRTTVNTFHDRGLMSLAIPPDYRSNPWLFMYIVYDFGTSISQFEGPQTSRVMKVRAGSTGLREDPSTRTVILGRRVGPGCDSFGADSDCIPTEGKSHVGGGLAFRSDGSLYVTVGDGAIAIVTPVALRAQQMGIYSGKVLLINQDGRGLRSNPWYNGNPDSRNSKIYAIGTRNIFAIHVNPDDDDHVYAGDTQWNDMEEVSVIRRGQNYGWPCYESFLPRPEYANDRECRNLGAHTLPLVGWPHRDRTSASMIGGKIRIPGWPRRYQGVVVYADMAKRFVGLCRVNANDELVEDMERIQIQEAAVQFRVGPDNALYWINVRDRGELRRLTYRPDPAALSLGRLYPAQDAQVPRDAGLTISAEFSKSVDPATVLGNVRLVAVSSGAAVPTRLEYNFGLRVFSLTVRDRMPAGSRLRVVVSGGGGGVRDLDGNILRRDLSWTFVTAGGAAAADTTRPAIDSTSPADGSTDVSLNEPIVVSFSEPMRPASVLSSFTLHRARRGDPSGAPLPATSVSYEEAARELRFTAPLAYDTPYVVTVAGGAGGAADLAGNTLRTLQRFRFRTAASTDTIAVTITEPAEGTRVSVGDDVNFRATARLRDGTTVPSSAFNWQFNVLHCVYDAENECHDHGEYTFLGTRFGTARAVDHLDRFEYELRLTINYNGQTGFASRAIATRTRAVTLQSNVPGVQLSLSGYTRTAPFTQPVVLGSSMQLFAPETVEGYVFDSWSNAGTRVQSLTVNGGGTYTANYRRARGGAQTPFVRLASTPAAIPLTGSITIQVDYYFPRDADIKGNVRLNSPLTHLFGRKIRVPAGEGSVSLTIPIERTLEPNVEHNIEVNVRPAGGARDTIVDSASAVISTEESGAAVRNQIVTVSPPLPLPVYNSVPVTVRYTSQMTVILLASVYDFSTASYVGFGSTDVRASAATRRITVQVPLRRRLSRGNRYRIRCVMRPVGGRPADNMDRLSRVVVA
mmetsp:Transcript_6755/g.20468  ORF Transcript_6755/g.20468 Transcript_6755/m.20468 type:complete len:1206 (+) Transcript_6755:540-4157(+)